MQRSSPGNGDEGGDGGEGVAGPEGAADGFGAAGLVAEEGATDLRVDGAGVAFQAGLEGLAAAFGVGQGSSGGFVGLEGAGHAVVGVGVDAVVDIGDVEAFGQDFEVAGVRCIGDEEVADGGALHGLDALDGCLS